MRTENVLQIIRRALSSRVAVTVVAGTALVGIPDSSVRSTNARKSLAWSTAAGVLGVLTIATARDSVIEAGTKAWLIEFAGRDSAYRGR